MKQVALEGFLKKHRDVSRTIATATMGLFVALVSSLQPLITFTKNLNIGAMGVLIKYSKSLACNFSEDNLFHSLMNYLNSSSDCICISYFIS